jgi:type I restriction enzyme S subunit
MRIPQDWDLVFLPDAVDFLDEQRRPIKMNRRAAIKGTIPYYGASGVIDYVDQFLFNEPLILLGEDGENILSRSVPLAFKIEGPSWVNNHAHVLRPKESFNIDFLTAYLDSLDYAALNSGTAQPKLNKNACSKILVIKPPLVEQRRISAVLNETDSFIVSLEKLISKKQAIKQGMMQQLLTGKTRLPGFEEPWRAISIKELVSSPVTDGPHLTPQFRNDGVPFLSVNNIVDGKIHWSDVRYISKEDDAVFSQKCKPRRGDILLGKAASVGKVALVDTDIDMNIWSPIALIRPSDQFVSEFVYFQLQSDEAAKQIGLLTNTSSQGNIGMGDIERISLLFPEKSEQVEIAKVLDDATSEISHLQKQLKQSKRVKVGMMQELLTGRTRLASVGV